MKEDNYLRIERTYGSFSRSFGLPNTVNTDAIKAEYNNGVLTIELPKRAESKPKQVKINVTNGNWVRLPSRNDEEGRDFPAPFLSS